MDMSVSVCNALTARWALTEPGVVFSAAGVYPLLALLATAADGPARAELLAVAPSPLQLPDDDEVHSALGIWSVSERARGERLTGDPTVDQPVLDAWAAAHTAGLIPTMPVRVDKDTSMVLASALAIVTEWAHPFTDGVMSPSGGPWAGRQLAALHRTTPDLAALRVAQTAAGPLTLLTVAGRRDVDVLLCLGTAGAAPGQVLATAIGAQATAIGVQATAAPATDGPGILAREVDAYDPAPELTVSTPRFDVSASHDLLADPELFGLRSASLIGTFPGISPDDLVVSSARQSAVATFTATGFRAAAVTAMAMVPVSFRMPTARKLRVSVTFDRPFGYLAVHRPTGLVLVAGWVTGP
jgi:hypothetical protein